MEDFKKKLALSFPLSDKQINELYNWIIENYVLIANPLVSNWLNDRCINTACWFHNIVTKNNCANEKINDDITGCSPRVEHKQLLNQIVGKEKADKISNESNFSAQQFADKPQKMRMK